MKKINFTLTMLFAAISAFAQVPNGNFELWTTDTVSNSPDNYNCYNTLKVSPGHFGNYAVNLQELN